MDCLGGKDCEPGPKFGVRISLGFWEFRVGKGLGNFGPFCWPEKLGQVLFGIKVPIKRRFFRGILGKLVPGLGPLDFPLIGGVPPELRGLK